MRWLVRGKLPQIERAGAGTGKDTTSRMSRYEVERLRKPRHVFSGLERQNGRLVRPAGRPAELAIEGEPREARRVCRRFHVRQCIYDTVERAVIGIAYVHRG